MTTYAAARVPIWLDCDPGHDDAMAIILAGHTNQVQLLGVSTVAGNQTVEKVTQNALDVLSACGLEYIDVVQGASKPIMRPPLHCPSIHGESGLDGPRGGRLLPLSTRKARAGKAINIMFEAIRKQWELVGGAEKIRLVCTGALSNAALLLMVYPEVVDMMEVVLMGGCMGLGNTGPVVEFNIQVDPEAAKAVFESGVPLTMVPLEVTHTVLATRDVLSSIRGSPAGTPSHSAAALPPTSSFRQTMVELLLFFADTYRTVFGFADPPLHDPCAVAYVIAPQLFKVKHIRVDIETQSPLSAGQTVCDMYGTTGRPPNCKVAMAVDVPAFWRLMLAAISAADAVSPLNRGSAATKRK